MFQATIKHAYNIKRIFLAINQVLNQVNIHFNDEGLKICALSADYISMVKLFIPASDFNYLECTNCHVLGVDIGYWNKLMQLCKDDDEFTLFVSDEDRLKVHITDTS